MYTQHDDDGSLPESRFIGFYAIPGFKMSEVVSRCLPHRQYRRATCPRSLRSILRWVRTCDLPVARQRKYPYTIASHLHHRVPFTPARPSKILFKTKIYENL